MEGGMNQRPMQGREAEKTMRRQVLISIGLITLLFAFWVAGSLKGFTLYLPREIPALIVLGLLCIAAVTAG